MVDDADRTALHRNRGIDARPHWKSVDEDVVLIHADADLPAKLQRREAALLNEAAHVSLGCRTSRCDVVTAQEELLGVGWSVLGAGHTYSWSGGQVGQDSGSNLR